MLKIKRNVFIIYITCERERKIMIEKERERKRDGGEKEREYNFCGRICPWI